MTVALAIIGALLLVSIVFIVSMRLTDRKTNQELRRRTPDGSATNADSGYATPVGGD